MAATHARCTATRLSSDEQTSARKENVHLVRCTGGRNGNIYLPTQQRFFKMPFCSIVSLPCTFLACTREDCLQLLKDDIEVSYQTNVSAQTLAGPY